MHLRNAISTTDRSDDTTNLRGVPLLRSCDWGDVDCRALERIVSHTDLFATVHARTIDLVPLRSRAAAGSVLGQVESVRIHHFNPSACESGVELLVPAFFSEPLRDIAILHVPQKVHVGIEHEDRLAAVGEFGLPLQVVLVGAFHGRVLQRHQVLEEFGVQRCRVRRPGTGLETTAVRMSLSQRVPASNKRHELFIR